jgi:TatD DNase family protein
MTTLYDTHAHLDHRQFAADLPLVLERAAAAGIRRLITVGTDMESSRRAVALAEAHPEIYAVVGWHPGEALTAPADLRPWLREAARHPKVVALGETGLDYYRMPPGGAAVAAAYKARQAELFRQHLEVAAEVGLNCVIHQRAAWEDTLRLFEPFAERVRGQFHCFSEGPAALERILALGSLVSFTGILTFKNGEAVRAALAATPRDRFLLETDCPYLAPQPFRGQRCEPAHVRETAAVVAAVTGLSLEELGAATCATAHRFFPKLG